MELLGILIELIIADLILGGDNAIVIALATKSLDQSLKFKASIIGALFAILMRVILVGIIMFIGEMHIAFLNIIAGGLLIYIALQLLKPENHEKHNIKAEKSISKAVKTIVVADLIMSLDNAIIIATIASTTGYIFEYQLIIVAIGLLFSFPIILFGASILSKLIDKFSWIVYVFSFILVHAAIEMIINDKVLMAFSDFFEINIMNIIFWIISAGIIFIGYKLIRKDK